MVAPQLLLVLPGLVKQPGQHTRSSQCARWPAPAMVLSYDEKLQLVRAGLAVPGFAAEGREAAREIDTKLEASGIFEVGRSSRPPARTCTREEPCDLQADVLRQLLLVPLPFLLAGFAYVLGTQAFGTDDDNGWLERVERQAERSRQRRLARQRDLAARLLPLQRATGWSLVTEDGRPTQDAYVFLALAVVMQVGLAFALAEPLRDVLPS